MDRLMSNPFSSRSPQWTSAKAVAKLMRRVVASGAEQLGRTRCRQSAATCLLILDPPIQHAGRHFISLRTHRCGRWRMATVVCTRCGFSCEVIRIGPRDLRTRGDLPSFLLRCVNRGSDPGTIRADNLVWSDLDTAILRASQRGRIWVPWPGVRGLWWCRPHAPRNPVRILSVLLAARQRLLGKIGSLDNLPALSCHSITATDSNEECLSHPRFACRARSARKWLFRQHGYVDSAAENCRLTGLSPRPRGLHGRRRHRRTCAHRNAPLSGPAFETQGY